MCAELRYGFQLTRSSAINPTNHAALITAATSPSNHPEPPSTDLNRQPPSSVSNRPTAPQTVPYAIGQASAFAYCCRQEPRLFKLGQPEVSWLAKECFVLADKEDATLFQKLNVSLIETGVNVGGNGLNLTHPKGHGERGISRSSSATTNVPTR